MGMIVYRENYTLGTDITGFDLEASGGWTPDCNGKQDFDPYFVEGSSRVFSDGDYVCSIVIRHDEIVTTGIQRAPTVEDAKRRCVEWMNKQAIVIRSAIEAAYLPNPGDSQ